MSEEYWSRSLYGRLFHPTTNSHYPSTNQNLPFTVHLNPRVIISPLPPHIRHLVPDKHQIGHTTQTDPTEQRNAALIRPTDDEIIEFVRECRRAGDEAQENNTTSGVEAEYNNDLDDNQPADPHQHTRKQDEEYGERTQVDRPVPRCNQNEQYQRSGRTTETQLWTSTNVTTQLINPKWYNQTPHPRYSTFKRRPKFIPPVSFPRREWHMLRRHVWHKE